MSSLLTLVLLAAPTLPTVPQSPPAMPAMVQAVEQHRVQVHLDWLREINGPYREARPTVAPKHVTVEPRTAAPPGGNTGMGTGVEQWRPLVEVHFGPLGLTDEALAVMACESGGNPNAQHPRSKAGGLFQFIPSTWAAFGSGSVFDPEANVAAAARLVAHSISVGAWRWSHWTCQP